jgi:glycosyltransferase involved in cell wall biosynthesis
MPEPLRVALISTACATLPGSMRAYADTLVDALRRHAPEVDARVVELDPTPLRGPLAQRVQLLTLPYKAWRLRGSAPDVWHVLDGSRAFVATGLRHAPVVTTVHDIIPWLQSQERFKDAPRTGAASRWLWRHNARALRRAALLVCDSERTRSDLVGAFAVGAEAPVIALPLRSGLRGHAGATSAMQRERGLLLHVGHNGFYKNRAQALRIFARIDRALATKLVMIGPAPTEALQTLARDLGISAAVHWCGDPEDGVLVNWYRRASVLVFPSLYEGYGWPVLEAMAFGLPVVSSNAGSLPEVAGDAVPCVEPDDIDGFVTHISRLLRDRQAAACAEERARVRAAEFSTERFAREMGSVYRLAASRAKGATQG